MNKIGIKSEQVQKPNSYVYKPLAIDETSDRLCNCTQHYARELLCPSTLNELLELTQDLSAQMERIGERCVTLWGKGS